MLKSDIQRHNHLPDFEGIHLQKFRADCSHRIRGDPSRSVHKSYDHVLREHCQAGGNVELLPQYKHIRSSFYRARSSVLPQVPETLDDLEGEGPWDQTWRGENFKLHQSHHGVGGFFVRCQEFLSDVRSFLWMQLLGRHPTPMNNTGLCMVIIRVKSFCWSQL